MANLERALDDRVSLAIATNPYLAGRNLHYETSAGKVRLSGVVRSYFQKQMAQEMLRRIDGVAAIENDLEVSWENTAGTRGATLA
jgi:osmotically-inducible protein OsmY